LDCWKTQIANNLAKWGIQDSAAEKIKELEASLQNERKERDELAQRVVLLEADQKLVDKVCRQAGLQKVLEFIRKLPNDDLQVMKQLGFNDVIDTNSLEGKHIAATIESSNTIKLELSKHIDIRIEKLTETMQQLEKVVKTTLEGFEKIDLPQATKDAMTLAMKSNINDTQSQIKKWGDYKAELNKQQ